MAAISEICMNEPRFMGLLEKLIGESKRLQNNPAQGLVPQEDLACAHILEVLRPHTKENGGPLEISKINFVEGRGNLIIKYPGKAGSTKICSFVGSHMDVVPASPEGWDRDPFTLEVDGDVLYGRGTTDCLGHVTLLTDFMASLAELRLELDTTIMVVFIANEENATFVGVGVDQLEKEGYMDECKNGPVFWIDSADSQPCIGTAGNIQWKMEVTGKLFHSGLPHRGINSIEMGMDVISTIQNKFYSAFPRTADEDTYNYTTCSTMKPCQISCTPGALNQLPPKCTLEGDIRLSPFYDIFEVKRKIEGWVDEINANPSKIESHGPHSHYKLEDMSGSVALTWLTGGENGIACNLKSRGYEALMFSTEKVLGSAKPYSIGGSLPLIRDLQDKGFDVMVAGYGSSAKYHADNESASLTDFRKAIQIIANIVHKIEN